MKKIFSMLFCSLLLFSCGDTPTETPPKKNSIILDVPSLDYDVSGGSKRVLVSSSSDWILTGGQAWCVPSKTSGANKDYVSFVVEVNPTTDERSVVYTFTCVDKSAKLTISQKQKNSLTATPPRFDIPIEGKNIEIEVIANVDFTFSIADNCTDWVSHIETRATTTSTLEFHIDASEEATSREGAITIKSDDIEEEIKIFQAGEKKLILTKETYSILDTGETIRVDLSTNYEYDVVMPDVDWVSTAATRAMSTYTHYYTINPNTTSDNRSAIIIYKDKKSDLQESITIEQGFKRDITVLNNEYTPSADGEVIEVDITHNVELSFEHSEWIHLLPATRNTTSSKREFRVDPNSDFKTREGYIRIFNDTVESTISITQSAKNGIVIDVKEYPVEAIGGSVDILVQSNLNYDFTIQNSATWVTESSSTTRTGLTPRTHTFNVDENTTTDERVAEIKFFNDDNTVTETIYIRQKQADKLFVVKSHYDIPKGGEIIVVELNANVPYEVNIPDIYQTWIHPITTSRGLIKDDLQFRIDANRGAEIRDGVINIVSSTGNLSADVTISQVAYGAFLSPSIESHTFEYSSDSQSISVDISTNLSSWMVSSDKNWCSISPASGSEDGNITISASANTTATIRQAIVTISGGSGDSQKTKTITISQKPKAQLELTLNNQPISTFDAPCTEVNQIITVESNTSWVASSDESWCNVTPASGSNNGTVTLSVLGNRGSSSRSATVTLTAGTVGNQQTKTIAVTQSAFVPTMTISATTWNPTGDVSSTNITVESNISWVASSDQSWCSITPTSGENNGSVTLNVLENVTSSSRSATITLIAGNSSGNRITRTIAVVQQKKDNFVISTTPLSFKSTSSNKSITLTSNNSWTASSNQSWCTIYRSSGSASSYEQSVRISVSANESATREATLTFISGSIEKTIQVTQYQAPSLSVKDSELFAPFQSTSYSLPISSNTTWRVSSDQSWCGVSPSSGEGNGSILFSLSENEITEYRTATITITAGSEQVGEVTHTLTIRQNPLNNFGIDDWGDGGEHGGNAE